LIDRRYAATQTANMISVLPVAQMMSPGPGGGCFAIVVSQFTMYQGNSREIDTHFHIHRVVGEDRTAIGHQAPIKLRKYSKLPAINHS
jgi:hypothetical protein